MNHLLSKEFQNKTLSGLKQAYIHFYEQIKEFDFNIEIQNIFAADKYLSQYSPIGLYWLELVNQLAYIDQLHTDAQEAEEDDLMMIEPEIFSFWEKTNFAGELIHDLEKQINLLDVSHRLYELYFEHIISFYFLHFSTNLPAKRNLYYPLSDIGEITNRLYPTKNDGHLRTEKYEQSLELSNVHFDTCPNEYLDFQDYKIELRFDGQKANLRKEEIKQRIGEALENIKKCSPELLTVFFNFTHTIIPIDEPGIVSYSSQYLPGFSCINFFERDNLDLMDDLLHENGHHYLNAILNYCELINEDDEKIYYSPWREALRPIRGIYHAAFTFYWALELYSKLNIFINSDMECSFSNYEITKIKRRFLEEFLMISYCAEDLNKAYHEEKITDEGKAFIDNIYQLLPSYQEQFDSVLNSLNSQEKGDIFELKQKLSAARSRYK